jgi:hypothetical protein
MHAMPRVSMIENKGAFAFGALDSFMGHEDKGIAGLVAIFSGLKTGIERAASFGIRKNHPAD